MDSSTPENKSPIQFFLLLFALSLPFWIIGFIFKDITKSLPIKLPISALMTFCPLIAAAILVNKKRKIRGVGQLLKQAFDFEKIRDKRWYLAIVFLMPFIAVLSYGYLKMTAPIQTEPQLLCLSVLVFFFVYFIGAIGEEIGWSGYILDPLQNRYGALKASFILGFVWAIWHIIPWSQTGQIPVWIIWQSIGTIFLRVIMVWIFNNTGKSVFAMILFHTMINISPYLIPNYGSHYDPCIFGILLIFTAILVTHLWGAKTLGEYKYVI